MRRSLILLPLVLLAGCGFEPPSADTLNRFVTGQSNEKPAYEVFVPLPVGLPTSCGPALRDELIDEIERTAPGTHLTFFYSDSQELITSFTVPQGSAALRKKRAERSLAPVWDRLDPELAGGSQAVHLIAIPASIRKYRKSELPPRIVVVGSMLTVDHEGNGSVTENELPCDGCATDANGCYARMEDFPAGAKIVWLTPTASWGNGPAHRNQVENHQRYVTSVKQAEIVRITPDTSLAFNFSGSQWDEPVAPRDSCNGVKNVDPDPPKPKRFDANGDELVELSPGVKVTVQPPTKERMTGPLERVLFVPDTSGSVAFDAEGNPRPGPFEAIKADLCEKIMNWPMSWFAICGFGGADDYQPRLSRFPYSLMSGLYWVEATPANRERAVAFVQGLQAGGGTPTRAALNEALKLEGPFVVCLYSDGIPTLGEGGMEGVLEETDRLKAAGVTVNTIGVGSLSVGSEVYDQSGADFLARLALKTGGDYFALSEEEPIAQEQP